MNKKNWAKLCLSALSATLCLGVLPIQATVIEQERPSDILRPYTFGFGSAQDGDEGATAMIEETGMEHLTFTDSSGYSINYWAYIPKDDQGDPIENLPVFVYMHGYSDGGGENNIAVRYHNAIVFRLLQLRNDPDYQAIILVPQTPNAMNPATESDYFKDQWVGIRGNDKWSQWNIPTWDMASTPRTANLNAVVELIKDTQAKTNADVDRAYVSGISMGGYTTWDLISRDDADMFAAAVPICGVGDPQLAANAKDVPIWMFHGTVDDTINVRSSRIMYEELRKYGNVTYTEYSAEAHPSWNSAYSPTLDDDQDGMNNLDDLIDWMFNQSRNGTLDGTVDTAPLIGVIWDAQHESESAYDAARYAQLQAECERAQRLLENGDEEQIKESIRLLDAIMRDPAAPEDASASMLERAVLRAQRILDQETVDETTKEALSQGLKIAEEAQGQDSRLAAYLQLENVLGTADDARDAMELERFCADLEQLDLSNFSQSQQEAVHDAQAIAQRIVQEDQPASEAIEDAYAGILSALDEEIQSDLGILNALIDQAETALAKADAYDQKAESWTVFIQAYEAACVTRDDPQADVATIAQAALTLSEAYAELRLLPDAGQMAQLNELVAMAAKLDRQAYDAKTLAKIDAAVAQAQRMMTEGFDDAAYASFLPQLENAMKWMTQPPKVDQPASARPEDVATAVVMPHLSLGAMLAASVGALMLAQRRKR